MGSAIVLMIIFAVASGAATIIESKTSTEAAWYYVYGAGWFALIQLLLGINLAFNIFRYNLIDPKKLPSLIFHLGFIVILIGAASQDTLALKLICIYVKTPLQTLLVQRFRI